MQSEFAPGPTRTYTPPINAPAPRPGRKYFSVDEANRSLPLVSRIVNDIMHWYQSAVDTRHQIEQQISQELEEQLRSDYELAMERLNLLIDELQQIGVELKDFEKGLVDFPAVHLNREISLCWHSGETNVHTWHEVDAGYAGRQDVTMLLGD
jgi:hypothetical protein